MGAVARVGAALFVSYVASAVYGFSVIPESASDHEFTSAMGTYILFGMGIAGALSIANEIRIYRKPR